MKATANTIFTSISRAGTRLLDAGMLLDKNDSIIERVNGRRRITWAVNGTGPDLIGEVSSNVGEYLKFVNGRHYQFLLNDGSFIQLTYEFDSRSNIKSSRLVWYPCPVEFSPEVLDFATFDEIILSTPVNSIFCKTPIRVDFSPEQAADNHSCTHIHLGMESCRLPVHRPLEPLRFLRLVIRTIYPQLWEAGGFNDVEDWAGSDHLTEEDKKVGFLSWNLPVGI